MNLTGLAARLRDGWFGLLGSTEGFPYGANLFFQAILGIALQPPGGGALPADPGPGSPGLPLTLTLTLTDSNGNVAASGSFTLTATGQTLVLNGTFDLTLDYTLAISGPAGWTFTIAQFNYSDGTPSGPSISTSDLQGNPSGTNIVEAVVMVAPAAS